jgi:hypothetical protein
VWIKYTWERRKVQVYSHYNWNSIVKYYENQLTSRTYHIRLQTHNEHFWTQPTAHGTTQLNGRGRNTSRDDETFHYAVPSFLQKLTPYNRASWCTNGRGEEGGGGVTAVSVAILYSGECQNDGWIERKLLWLNRGNIAAFAWWERRKPLKTSIKTVGVPVDFEPSTSKIHVNSLTTRPTPPVTSRQTNSYW